MTKPCNEIPEPDQKASAPSREPTRVSARIPIPIAYTSHYAYTIHIQYTKLRLTEMWHVRTKTIYTSIVIGHTSYTLESTSHRAQCRGAETRLSGHWTCSHGTHVSVACVSVLCGKGDLWRVDYAPSRSSATQVSVEVPGPHRTRWSLRHRHNLIPSHLTYLHTSHDGGGSSLKRRPST